MSAGCRFDCRAEQYLYPQSNHKYDQGRRDCNFCMSTNWYACSHSWPFLNMAKNKEMNLNFPFAFVSISQPCSCSITFP